MAISFGGGGISGMQPSEDGSPPMIIDPNGNRYGPGGVTIGPISKTDPRVLSAPPANLNQAKPVDPYEGQYKFNKSTFNDPYLQANQNEFDQYVRKSRQDIYGQQDDFRKKQIAFAEALQQQAAGTGGPSVAEQQLKTAHEQNLKSLLSAQASQRGYQNAGAVQRNLMNAYAEQTAQQNAQASQLRAQEQLAAQQQYNALLNQGRATDLGSAQQAQQAQQAYAAMLANQRQQQFLSNIELEKLRAEQFTSKRSLDQGLSIANKQSSDSLKTALIGAGAAAGAAYLASDKRLKKDISPAEDDVYKFLDELNASNFKYKNGDDKNVVGVMAQDLEKTKLGDGMVEGDPKIVNLGKGFGVILAAQAELHKRLKALESTKK